MELGGVSVPGRSPHDDGAFLLKDLSAFETKLGGLKAFVMVSDGMGGGQGDNAAAHLAVKAADAYLGSILIGIAAGNAPQVEPAQALKTIVAQANAAIIKAAAAGGSSMSATFVGAFVSAEKIWFGQVGDGRVYLLGGDEVRQLVVDHPEAEDAAVEGVGAEHVPSEGASVAEPPAGDATDVILGREGVVIDVGCVELSPGDAVVLCSQGPSATLSGSDILGTSTAARDAQSAASGLALAAAGDAEEGATVAVWSDNWSLFAPPPPQAHDSSAVIYAASDDTSGGNRAERIFLITMSVVLAVEVLALLGMALIPRFISPGGTPPASSVSGEAASQSASQTAAVATVTPDATASVEPTEVAQAEFPKTLTVPRNVKGGLWLRKNATTLGGSNLVAQLRSGSTVEAVDTEEAEDAKGKTQKFYVFKVSDISSDDVLETDSHPWPPSKSVKTVYAFAASFEEPE